MLNELSPIAVTDGLFFESGAELDRDAAERIVREALAGKDDGELFLEYRENEHVSLDDGRIRAAGFNTHLGFGLRAIHGEECGYAHAGEVSEAALRRAAETVSAGGDGVEGVSAAPPSAKTKPDSRRWLPRCSPRAARG